MKQVSTNWDEYYQKPYKAASITRRYTSNKLIEHLTQCYSEIKAPLNIAEIGGANSCFFDAIAQSIRLNRYAIFDNNQEGLNRTIQRIKDPCLEIHNQNALFLNPNNDFDIVFSVGLVEHFNKLDTATVIKNHFKLVRPGGCVIISFPTPTWLYKIARVVAELSNKWIFFDERPLPIEEVVATVSKYGEISSKSILWPIVFTQCMLVIKNCINEI